MYLPTLNPLAAIVKLGFTPPELGMKLPSTTNRLSTPKNRHHGSSTAMLGSLPNLAVPSACE